MAFPKLNALSFWFFLSGGNRLLLSLFFGAPEAGWTLYAPLSDDAYTPGFGSDAFIFLAHLTGISSLVGSVNFVDTSPTCARRAWLGPHADLRVDEPHLRRDADRRAAGHRRRRDAPAHRPPLRHALLRQQRRAATRCCGQHLFWFFGHPEVYIMIIPGFGIISEVLPVFSRKPIFGYKALAARPRRSPSSARSCGRTTCSHTPSPTAVLAFFMIGSFLIGVPTGIKSSTGSSTMYEGAIEFKTPLLYAVRFLSLFLIGGITGIFLATFPVDCTAHDSYFVVAHFHYVLVGGAMFAITAASTTGTEVHGPHDERDARQVVLLVHVHRLQHDVPGPALARPVGHAASYLRVRRLRPLATLNLISTIGAFTLAVGLLLSMINAVPLAEERRDRWSDPWRANTLEWFIPSPPPAHNFDIIPTVRSVEPMKDIRQEVAARSQTTSEPANA